MSLHTRILSTYYGIPILKVILQLARGKVTLIVSAILRNVKKENLETKIICSYK